MRKCSEDSSQDIESCGNHQVNDAQMMPKHKNSKYMGMRVLNIGFRGSTIQALSYIIRRAKDEAR